MTDNEQRLAGENPLHRLLEWPPVYRLATLLLAPGSESRLNALIVRCAKQIGISGDALDVGCGPFSRLAGQGFDSVTGADVSPVYVTALEKSGVRGVVSSADALPFPDSSFRTVWNIGLLHHLPDVMMQGAVRQMLRVSGPQGHVVVIDAVLPRSALLRPLAWITRRLDRGRHMRTQPQLETLLRACG
jgi:SAM-dependent methyltransferase